MSLCEKLLCPDNVLWFCDVNGKAVVMTFLASYWSAEFLAECVLLQGPLVCRRQGIKIAEISHAWTWAYFACFAKHMPEAAAEEHLRPPHDAAIIGACGIRAACSSV